MKDKIKKEVLEVLNNNTGHGVVKQIDEIDFEDITNDIADRLIYLLNPKAGSAKQNFKNGMIKR